MLDTPKNCDDFVPANVNTKSELVARLVLMARKERLDYDDFLYVCQQARHKLGLSQPKRHRKLPQLLSEPDLKRFFRAIQECGKVHHEITLKFLFFTSIPVSDLITIS